MNYVLHEHDQFCEPKRVTDVLREVANAGFTQLLATLLTSLWKASLQAGKKANGNSVLIVMSHEQALDSGIAPSGID